MTQRIGRGEPASRVLSARLVEQVAALHEAEAAIRDGRTDGVHDARVACRRLRGALATFRPLLRREAVEPLREELAWLARSFGEDRDHDVVHERLVTVIEEDGEPAGEVLAQLDARPRPKRPGEQPLDVLASARHADLLEALDALLADPPWTARAERPAGRLVRTRIGGEWERLSGTAAPVLDCDPGTILDEDLHDVRKASKRLRYALEVADLLWPKKPRRLRMSVHRLTDVLGERQDTVLTRTALGELAEQAEARGTSSFEHGRLDQLEERRALELEAEFKVEWAKTVRRRRSWP